MTRSRMIRARTINTWQPALRSSRRRLCRALACTALAATAALVAAPPAPAAFRAFSDASLWNVPAASKGPIDPGNQFVSQFTSYSSRLAIAGIPPNTTYAKPVYFATAGDPTRAGHDVNGWPMGDIKYDGGPIPVPAGMMAAPGSDGHVTIVSADRRKAWDMWRCKQSNGAPCDEPNVLASGYRAEIIAQWDLGGSGVPSVSTNNTSARGSGTPILPTSLRAEEALGGINHALGLTVPQVSSQYIYPVATHSDGSLDTSAVKYGMLFVLRSDYPVPANASVGVRNVIAALKTYGAYVVDQGASFQLDADSTRPDLWLQAGVSEGSLGAITPYDMRSVGLGGGPTPAPTPTPTPGSGSTTGGKPCTKQRQKHNLCTVVSISSASAPTAGAAGSSAPVIVEGSVPAKDAGGSHRANIQVKGSKGWRTVATTRVRVDGSFRLKLPAKVRRGHRRIRVRIVVPGVGVSREMVIRLHR
jgi:hypothetical protein